MSSFEEQWRARFERYGQVYSDEHQVSGWSSEGLRRRLKLFERVMADVETTAVSRILDLGCGGGTYVRLLGGPHRLAVGVDYSMPTLRRAADTDRERKGRYLAADAYRLPFRTGAFDLVLSIGVMQALSAPERLLDEVSRLLRPGGLTVIEALNAREVPAMARRAVERLRGQDARVHAYHASTLEHWLHERGVALVRTLPVYLPPRRWPRLGELFDRPFATRLAERIPGCSTGLAHAFWFVGRKSP